VAPSQFLRSIFDVVSAKDRLRFAWLREEPQEQKVSRSIACGFCDFECWIRSFCGMQILPTLACTANHRPQLTLPKDRHQNSAKVLVIFLAFSCIRCGLACLRRCAAAAVGSPNQCVWCCGVLCYHWLSAGAVAVSDAANSGNLTQWGLLMFRMVSYRVSAF